jgi:hypothetical protein
MVEPAAPVADGFVEQAVAVDGGAEFAVVAALDVAEGEAGGFAGAEVELGGDAGAFDLEGDFGEEGDALGSTFEDDAPIDGRDGVGAAGVVEGGEAIELEVDRATDGADDADDFVDLFGADGDAFLVDGHEVNDLADALAAEEARHEDVGFGQVHLAVGPGVDGGDAEVAAAFGVEDGGEEAGGIEAGQAAPVDRSIHGDEGDGVEVADDAAGFDGTVGQGWESFRGGLALLYRRIRGRQTSGG